MNDERKGYLQWVAAHDQQTEEAKRAIAKICDKHIEEVRDTIIERLKEPPTDQIAHFINLCAFWGLTELLLRYRKPEGVADAESD